MCTRIGSVRRRLLAIASIAASGTGCVGISAGVAVAATGETATSPTARQVTIPGWLNPGQPVVAQDGDLWLNAQRSSSRGHRTELLEVTTAGKLIRRVDRNLTPLLIGPDGDLWLATTGRQVRLGSITPGGRVRVFGPLSRLRKSPENPSVTLAGATVGPNGDVWFAADSDYEGGSEVGYISPAGRITVDPISNNGDGWFDMTTDSNGYIWLSALDLSGSPVLTWISPEGRTGTLTGDPQGPLAPDLTGDVWAPDGSGAEFDEVRSEPPRRPETVRSVEWTSMALTRYNPPVGLATAADGQVWFLGAPCTSISAMDNCASYGHPELGSISSLGALASYPSPVPGIGNAPQLTTGPDGRLWTSTPGYSIETDTSYPANAGLLWAITLPSAPRMRAPSLRLVAAGSHARSTFVTLHCSGQPGRYCFGTIALRAGGSRLQTQSYAIDPGHATTYTFAVTEHGSRSPITVEATNTLPDGHAIQHLSATIRTVK
jgi:hypothetical protein